MVDWTYKDKYDLNDFIHIIDVLRSPGGCPWDIKQTHESLKRNAVEEAYEVCDAIDEGSMEHLREELGDLLFAAVKIARFFQIDAEDALAGTCEKFIRRFAGVEAAVTAQGRDMRELDVSQLMALWNREKHPENEERKGNHHEQD